MAVRTVNTDTNYSSLTFVDDDTIVIDYLATLTINTDTLRIGGVTFGLNGGGKMVINNTSTTTPIFVKVSGRATVSKDGIFESNGNLIEIGTGDGSTSTYNLPTGSGGSKYGDLGACWVDEGATFRDGSSYKTTYAQVSTLSNKLSAYTFGNVFAQDTTANTITFLKPVPNGYKIYVPNIQIIGTHTSNSAFTFQGRVNNNYTSFSRIVDFAMNGTSGVTNNYCGYGFCQTNNFSNSRRAAGRFSYLNTGFNWGYYLDLYGSGVGSLFKNVYYVSNFHSAGLGIANQGQGAYLEKITTIFDREDCGDPASTIATQPFFNFSAPNAKVYDICIGSVGHPFGINSTNTTFDNIVVLPTGNTVSAFTRSITNVVNNGSGLIRVTVNSNASFSTGQIVKISGVGGVTNANGTWRISVINAPTNTIFDLVGSTFSGTYTPSTGTLYTYANNSRPLIYLYDYASKNTFSNISILPANDVPVDPTHGAIHRGVWGIFSNTGNNYNRYSNCTFSCQTVYGANPLIIERGTYNRYNNFLITDSFLTAAYSSKVLWLDVDSYGTIATNFNTLSASLLTNGTFNYNDSKIERILIEDSNPSVNFGYQLTFTPVDSPSTLTYTNTNRTTGRLFVNNSLSANASYMSPSPINTGPYAVKEAKAYIQNTGDSLVYETFVYGGLTGIDTFCGRDETVTAIMVKDAGTNTDCPYQYALSMRRPYGTYTTPILVYGSRLTGSNQTANYNVGDSVAQTIATGLTAFGIVDLINSTELRICNITTLSSTPNPDYLWGHFLDNVTASGGTTQGIRNLTTSYTPPSNPFTNQYEYLPSKTVQTLNDALTSLPSEPTVKNQVQFKLHVIRDIKDGAINTFNQRFYVAAIDVKLDPNFEAIVDYPTYLNLTLNGGYIAIYDNAGVLRYYTNQDQVIPLDLDSVGTWTYRYSKYGYKFTQGVFTINQSTINITPVAQPDFYITENTVSLVSAYNTFSTTQNIYDYLSYYRTTIVGLSTGELNQYTETLDIGSKQLILSDTASPAFSYDGSKFVIKSSAIQGRPIQTTGGIILSGNNTFSNITLNADVSSNVVDDLDSVNVNGILTYNTNTNYNIAYTNTEVLTARNDGNGIIYIDRINSTINDATDPQIQSFSKTSIVLTLLGGYIAIYDNNGVQQYYTNTNGTIVLPYSATGNWTYRIGRYGYKMISGSFAVNPSLGGTVTITPTYEQDIYVNDIVSNVVNYTDFTNTQNIYDYLSYYRTTTSGLSSGELNSYIASLDIGSIPLMLSDTASPIFTYDGSQFIIKSSSIQGKTITTTGGINLSGSTTISNITLNADVSSNVVGNLNSVNVNGILTYNTNTPTNIVYTNTNVLTARNDGSAIVNIKRINSNITDATDAQIENYAPTYINLTLLGGYIAIYDDNNVQQYYRNTDGTIELPYSATGNWSYKIGRYGYKLVTGTFFVNRSTGGTFNIAPAYEQDLYVVDTYGNVSAYSTFTKTQHIYDYLSYYRTTSAGLSAGELNLYSSTLDVGSNNIILFDSASPAFSYDGSTITLNSLNLSGAPITTTGTISLSGNSSISDITLTTDVLDQTPADLTNVTINGILAYNTNSPASITYTNTTVDTVVNNGTGTVLIQRINSSINNATDPEIDDYAPTVINVTPDGGSVAIYDDNDVRQYFIKTNSSIVLPSNATGTWSYKTAKYGYHLIDQSFTIDSVNGATINISPNYIPDTFINEIEANVINYTDLNNANEIHDYLMYFQTLSTGIDYGDLESESFGTLTFTGSVALSSDATQMVSLSGATLILKSTNITDDIVLVSPGEITQHAGNTISDDVKLRTNSLDSEVYLNLVDSLTLFPSEILRDDNDLTNSIYLASPSIYRFKYGSVVNGVTLSNFLYGRVSTGGSILLIKSPISLGTNTIDFGTTGNLTTIINNLRVVNNGVKKSSILIPHTTNI